MKDEKGLCRLRFSSFILHPSSFLLAFSAISCSTAPEWLDQLESTDALPPPRAWLAAPSTAPTPHAADMATTQPDIPKTLALRDAFRLALQANKDIAVATLGAEAGYQRIDGPEGEFDPTVFLEATRGKDDGSGSDLDINRLERTESDFLAGVRQRAQTGTTVEVAAVADYVRDRNDLRAINPSYNTELRLLLRQDLLKDFGIDINRTDILVARNNWQISVEQLRRTLMDNLFLVEQAYWELVFAEADLHVREEQLARAQKLVALAEAQVRIGISAPVDVVRARSSAASQSVALPAARNQVARLRHRLLRLLGVLDVDRATKRFRPADTPPATPTTMSLPEALDVAHKHRPEYLQAELAVKNAELAKRFAENQVLPKLEAFGEYTLLGLDTDLGGSVDLLTEGENDRWTLGLRFEVPIPNRTARSASTVARLEFFRARLDLRAVSERITREVADALDDLASAAERITAAREARQLAQQLLKAEEKSFQLGRSDSLDVLTAQASVANAERQEIRARTDYATARAGLYRVQGDFLQRHGIAFVADERD